MNLTENEKNVIVNIAENDYSRLNSATPSEPNDTLCYSDCLDCGPRKIPSGKHLSGIVSSLSKKDLIQWQGEGYIGLSENGFEIYKMIKGK